MIKLCWDKSPKREGNWPRMPDVSVPCLRERVREMSVEQYQGLKPQKMLLKWLLRGALVVESVSVNKDGGYMPTDLVNEIKSWAVNPATTMTFS
jgi:hypothetical protein